jgi:long-chain acyl-CoA synthetase
MVKAVAETCGMQREKDLQESLLGKSHLSGDPISRFVDRKKDMIKSGGENVSSQEVEGMIMKYPKVMQAAVIGILDPKRTEEVTAFVVPRPGGITAEEEIIAFCRERMAGYKVPKRVEVREEPLPKSGPGKVLKRELREPYWAGRDARVG